jgi:hypothetical protein
MVQNSVLAYFNSIYFRRGCALKRVHVLLADLKMSKFEISDLLDSCDL